MKLLLILAAAGGVYAVTRKKAPALDPMPKRKPGGFYLPQLTTSGGLSQSGEEILKDPSNLEGYFSTSGYFSTGACCSGCAHGRPCNS